jgi:hypothetical protein
LFYWKEQNEVDMRFLHLALLSTFAIAQTLYAASVNSQGQTLPEKDLDASVIDRKLEDDDEDKEKGESGYQFSAKKPPQDKDEDIALTDETK